MRFSTRSSVAFVAFSAASFLSSPVLGGDVVWDEFADGDISGDPAEPTPVSFNLGSNLIIGSVAGPDDVRDYITFSIPDGMSVSALLLMQYEDLDTGGKGNTGFQGVIEGSTSHIPDAGNIHLFLGASHLDWAPAGTDILPILADGGLGAQGFIPPLGPGTYTYHVQQTGPPLTGYTLDFVIVPAPGVAAIAPLCGWWAIRRRRRR